MRHVHTHSNTHRDTNIHPDSYQHVYSNDHSDTYLYGEPLSDIEFHRYAHGHRDTDTDAYGYTHAHPHADADGDPDGDVHPYANRSDCDADGVTDRDGDADRDPDADATHTHRNPDDHQHADGDEHAATVPDLGAELSGGRPQRTGRRAEPESARRLYRQLAVCPLAGRRRLLRVERLDHRLGPAR
jgi:hypothetical protein